MKCGAPLPILVTVCVLLGVIPPAHASDNTPAAPLTVISGIVRSTARVGGSTELAISNAEGITLVRLLDGDSPAAGLVDAAVRISGRWTPIRNDSGMIIRREFTAAPRALSVVTLPIAHGDLAVRPVA